MARDNQHMNGLLASLNRWSGGLLLICITGIGWVIWTQQASIADNRTQIALLRQQIAGMLDIRAASPRSVPRKEIEATMRSLDQRLERIEHAVDRLNDYLK